VIVKSKDIKKLAFVLWKLSIAIEKEPFHRIPLWHRSDPNLFQGRHQTHARPLYRPDAIGIGRPRSVPASRPLNAIDPRLPNDLRSLAAAANSLLHFQKREHIFHVGVEVRLPGDFENTILLILAGFLPWWPFPALSTIEFGETGPLSRTHRGSSRDSGTQAHKWAANFSIKSLTAARSGVRIRRSAFGGELLLFQNVFHIDSSKNRF